MMKKAKLWHHSGSTERGYLPPQASIKYIKNINNLFAVIAINERKCKGKKIFMAVFLVPGSLILKAQGRLRRLTGEQKRKKEFNIKVFETTCYR